METTKMSKFGISSIKMTPRMKEFFGIKEERPIYPVDGCLVCDGEVAYSVRDDTFACKNCGQEQPENYTGRRMMSHADIEDAQIRRRMIETDVRGDL